MPARIRDASMDARGKAVKAAWVCSVALLAPWCIGQADTDRGLDAITVVATGISNMSAASAGDVSQEQMMSQPLLRPAAVLENVPGLIVTQHSGEGKANQYFLRAFNLDHGTDLALEVDDMPVNMPSHAHGQGYADLNFLIPELAADLHYKKGPYYADEGDFATAGTARIGLVSEAPSSATLGIGENGYRRGLVLGSTALAGGTLLGAGEVYHNDGPFDVPDDYNRLNGVLRFHSGERQDFYSLTAMAYSGKWNSTDQAPERAITQGVIGRFGSLNPTDGGISSRESLSFTPVKRTETDQVQFSVYVIRYKLDLWSTFTYYLNDPVDGDQMLQHDDRVVYGFKGSRTWYGKLFGLPMSNVIGAQTRIDDIRDVGIFSSYRRRIMGTTQDAGVMESNAALYAENSVQWAASVRTVLGLREDRFDFDVKDKMRNAGTCNIESDPEGCDTGNKRASIFSPKLGIIFGPWVKTTFFINAGDGYHSNDARGVTRSGENPDVRPVTPLTRATSAEAGISSRINSWLAAEFKAAFTRARFDNNAEPDDLGCADAAPSHPCARPIGIVGRYIPNSPTNVIDAALTAHRESGWFGALRARHFGASPLVEDNSAHSPQYTTVDGQIGFQPSKRRLVALDVFNIAGVKWNDIEYYYVLRLKNEVSPAADYVLHPGVPRTARLHFTHDF